MKINSDSPDFQNRIDSTKAPAKADKAFGDSLASKAGAAANAQPLAGIAQGLKKADLADPAKADAAIQQAVHEIMGKEFGGMCAPDRDHVATWLSSDPLMRDALLKRLTSMAS